MSEYSGEAWVNVFNDVQRLAANATELEPEVLVSDSERVENITVEELAEVRRLSRPPVVVRRTLEATCLILQAAHPPARFKQPAWPMVQKRLAEDSFLMDVLQFDVSHLRAVPLLASFVATEYFSDAFADTSCKKSSPPKAETLTFARVFHANKAAAALFKWCARILFAAAFETDETIDRAPSEHPLVSEQEEPSRELAAASEIDETIDLPPPEQPHVPQEEEASQELVESVAHEEPELPSDTSEAESFRQRRLLKAWRDVCIASAPDRHFEVSIMFHVGQYSIGKHHLPTMMNMMSAMCGGPKLRLQLMGCKDALEGNDVSTWRLDATRKFLAKRGFSVFCDGQWRTATWTRSSGVLCKVHLDNERQLRDYFKARDAAWTDSSLGPSERELFCILLPAVAASYLGAGAEELDEIVVASRNHCRALQTLSAFSPLLEVSDILLAHMLEQNLQTLQH